MLQISEKHRDKNVISISARSVSTRAKTPPIIQAATKKNKSRSISSSLTPLIATHFKAMKARRLAEEKCQALYTRFPDLEERRPLVLMYVNREGIERFGRWTSDWDRAFTILGKASKKEPRERVEFREKCEAAFPIHQRKRRDAGIDAAENARGECLANEHRAWKAIKRYKPRSVNEMQIQLRHVIKVLPEKAFGIIYWSQFDAEKTSYAKYMERRHSAFTEVEELLRSLTKSRAA